MHDQLEPVADELYRIIWGPLRRLERFNHNQSGVVHPLDKEWAIDAVLETACGLPITIQDKFRDYRYYELYNEFTLEYENNPRTHVPGEFYHLVANYYFYGFASLDRCSFISWKIIDLNAFKECYRAGIIRESGIGKNISKGYASFLCFGWEQLERHGLLFRQWEAQ